MTFLLRCHRTWALRELTLPINAAGALLELNTCGLRPTGRARRRAPLRTRTAG